MTFGKGIHTDRRWKLENACDLVCSGDDTAEQILLIVTGHSNQKVGGCDAGVD